MKICEIIASFGNGGLENHFIDLTNGLVELGHEVHVIVPTEFTGDFSKQIIVHYLPFEKNRRNPFLLWQLYKVILAISPDIIHCHARKATALLSYLKSFLKIPCVATAHNLKNKLNFHRKMDAVIGVSAGVLANIHHSNSKLIYNGLNIKPSSLTKTDIEQRFNIKNDRPIVLSVGRLVEAKDFDMLISAWQNINADLLIVGDGPLKRDLTEQIKKLNLESKVHLLGYIPNASDLISAVDLVVISSIREGFNYVMAEALLQSKPLISTDVPAPNEVLPTQYLTPVSDALAMHNTLKNCFDNYERVSRDYQPLYKWAQNNFSLENMVKSTEDLLKKTASNSNL